ncbi:MAG: flagellar transcriptional regulator FlhD [Gammaproteobacteria bacterium]|nr:flagellar transcriptional regulator FlhD [Gammaproteobacteria bacterium]
MPSADPEIAELNLLWLIKARELARDNRKKAAVVLGLDARLLEAISRLSLSELNTMAQSGVMQFQPRFRSALLRRLIEQGGTPALSIRLQSLLMAAGEQAP